jgi:hypothetical protein
MADTPIRNSLEYARLLSGVGLDPSVCAVDVPGRSQVLTPALLRAVGPDGVMFLKRLAPPDAASGPRDPWDAHWRVRALEPRHWSYWRREADWYTSGLGDLFRPYGLGETSLEAISEDDDGATLPDMPTGFGKSDGRTRTGWWTLRSARRWCATTGWYPAPLSARPSRR